MTDKVLDAIAEIREIADDVNAGLDRLIDAEGADPR